MVFRTYMKNILVSYYLSNHFEIYSLGKNKERRVCKAVDRQKGQPTVIKNYQCKRRGNIANGIEKVSVNGSVLITEYKCKPFYKLKGRIVFPSLIYMI